MSYSTAESALVDLLATVVGLSSEQIGQDDHSLASNGYDQFVVTKYAGFEQTDLAARGCKLQTWEIDCELNVQWVDDVQVQTDLTALRQGIIDRVGVKPTMDGEVYWSDVVSGAQLPDAIEVGSVKYQREVIRLRVQEQVDYVYEE